MTHSRWCGKYKCSECPEEFCKLDKSIPCSPDCLGIDYKIDEPNNPYCLKCDAISSDQKDKIAERLRNNGIAICPSCNRGNVLRVDIGRYIRRYNLEHVSDERDPLFFNIGTEEDLELEELEEFYGECDNCHTIFQGHPEGGVYLNKIIK